MNGILANRTTRRRGVAYGLLLGICLILMAASNTSVAAELQRGVGFAFRPIESALTDGARSVTSVAGAITEIDHLRLENQTLTGDNERLSADNTRLQEIQRENDLLTGLLQIRSGLNFQTVAAQVVGRESSDFRRVVTLDQGSDRGVIVGDVVIGPGGVLAGIVTDVGRDFANVRLITDTQSTVVGQTQTSAAAGEVFGQLGGALVMQNVDATERPKIGDEVVTAGIELSPGIRSAYPKGLLIGQVIDVRRDANAVVQTLYLQPAVDLDKLEYALIITNFQGGPADSGPTNITNPDGTLPNTEQPYLTPNPTTKPKATAAPTATKKP